MSEDLKIKLFFDRLKKIDPAALTNLEKLVKMAETNPNKYRLALNFL